MKFLRALFLLCLLPSLAWADGAQTITQYIGTATWLSTITQASTGGNITFTVNGTALNSSGAVETQVWSSTTNGTGITFDVKNVTGSYAFKSNGNTIWGMSSAGDLVENGSNGGNITFARGLKGMASNFAALAAAGTTQTDAASMATVVAIVTGADAIKGVKLPPLTSIANGVLFIIINSSTTSAVKYYSNAAGELIDGQSGTTANVLAAKLWAFCFPQDSTHWYCQDGVTPF